MQNYFEAPKPKLIYVFRILDPAHKGSLKVGETTLDVDDSVNPFTIQPNASILNKTAKKRIDSYTQTAGIEYELLYTECTLHMQGMKIGWFNDKDVHEVLKRSGIKRKDFEFGDSKSREWFITDLETVKKAIVAVKEGRESLTTGEVTHDLSPIEFRPEQRSAINKTVKRFGKANKMLWNAKMRFGKTLSALQVAREMEFGRTLILTHRPVVDAGWFEDFNKIFYDKPNYAYGSKNVGSSHASLEKMHAKDGTRYVYFASMQDLRGSEKVGGKFDKNDAIFKTPWDFIIIDEAHEGTQTALGKAVITLLTKPTTKVLQLSGTPFNLMEEMSEDEIFTWDYTMEQRAKEEWDKNHFGDPNPYASLPRMNIYTYDLGRLLHNDEFNDEEIAFNFREFFRTDASGEFVHEAQVLNFLNLLTKEDPNSMYPFANKRYRSIFRHTLWMLPGVKEAKAMSALLRSHPVFGNFEIVNVAGDGDEEEAREEALKKVQKAIKDNPDGTITLSCGRLTTGASVPQWMGVLMLSGSYNTAASGYMQTIFRVQTPYTRDGLVKEDCYVFDFAPDRTLQVLATVPRVSTKAGKTTEAQKQALGDFLNFCPVIGMEGSTMKPYDANKMMEQLKKAYVERVVRNGFEDGYLYNDELLKLDGVALEEFQQLKKIIGTTKAMAKSGDIDVNSQGLTNEEYAEKEKLEKKPKKERTPEEEARLAELKEKRKTRDTAISILRGISIRMPLLIYGADITDEEKQLTIDNFTQLVDDQSWAEFMPHGVTKEVFNTFKKYYDDDIFASAGKRIRAMASAADRLTIEERIERITGIFNTFRNPDKETVLTPWRVVNMHLGDTLGGYNFYNEDFTETLSEPRYVEHHKVTDEVFTPGSHLLEINSKSGLYPLYLAYNLYRRAIKEETKSPQTLEQHQAIWDRVVRESIFVICKTPMAKAVTRRTLLGFRKGKVNTRYFEDLVNQIKNKPENFLSKVHRGKSFWKANDNDNMKFKAIVGNPPYQLTGAAGGNNDAPIFQDFCLISFKITAEYASMIIPSRWFSAGRENLLGEFRKVMLSSGNISKLVVYSNGTDVFSNVEIKGGICYFLFDNKYHGKCRYILKNAENVTQDDIKLDTFDILIRDPKLSRLVELITLKRKDFGEDTVDHLISNDTPFGIPSNPKKSPKNPFDVFTDSTPEHDVMLFHIENLNRKTEYVRIKDITKNIQDIDKFKVFVPGAGGSGNDPYVLGKPELAPKHSVCSQSYLYAPFETEIEASNFYKYLQTKFLRVLVSAYKITQSAPSKVYAFVPLLDLSSNSEIDWSQSISEIDHQLYTKYGLTEEQIAFIESMIKPM